MKWCNLEKETRRKDWFAIAISPEQHWGYRDRLDAHAWCVKYPSDGKFYHHYTNTRWWFEKESDALMFALTWNI